MNCTPDSISNAILADSTNSKDNFKNLLNKFLDNDFKFIDIGGFSPKLIVLFYLAESTRPGFTEVSVTEEINRLKPFLEILKSNEKYK